MNSTWVSIMRRPLHRGECHRPHESSSERTMADYKDFLVSEVITTGSEKENLECSDPSHPSAYNVKGSLTFLADSSRGK